LILAGLALLAVLAVVLLLAYVAAAWIVGVVIAAVVVALGLLGAPADHPIVGAAVVIAQAQRLTSEHVERALRALGLAGIGPKATVTFPAPISRDGPGWRAEVDLPYGVTATDVIERRDRLASGLRRPLGCCWPEPVHDQHAGRLVLWVGDQDMAKARQAPWPLRKARKATVFEALPFGTDQRGRPVGMDLMYSNLLIGALPGAGKTFALRVIVLGAAMDPTCELRIFELKGSGDLDPLEPISHHYGSGVDDDTIGACVASLREVYADLEVRAATIKRLARAGRCPENKVTPQLAADRSLGLWPQLFVVDECQELFSHEEFGKEAARLATAIIKRGRAFGLLLALATQRPDKDSLPKSISDNVGIRYCLRVVGQPANDMVLGTSMYQNGVRATMLRPSDKGVGYLVGASDEPQIVKGYLVNGDDAKRVVQTARLLREQAGTLTGGAVGEHQVVIDVLADVLAVAAGEERLWSSVLLERLGQLRP
ncbi:MAG: cell division protein FtsK, partial [Sciscionella sp.]